MTAEVEAEVATAAAGKAEGAEVTEVVEDAEVTEAAEGTEATEIEGQLKPGEIEGLAEESQEKINARIGKYAGRAKAAEARATEAEAALKALEDGRDAKFVDNAVKLGLHPDYASPKDVELLQRYELLKSNRSWLTKHKDEDDVQIGTKLWTRAELQDEALRVQEELEELAPQAAQVRRERSERTLAHLQLGREAEKAGWKPVAGAKPKPTVASGKPLTVPKPVIPRAGMASAAPRTGSEQLRRSAKVDEAQFAKQGGNRRALLSVYEGAG